MIKDDRLEKLAKEAKDKIEKQQLEKLAEETKDKTENQKLEENPATESKDEIEN